MRARVYVTRHLPEKAFRRLKEVCEVEIWDHDVPPPYETIKDRIRDKQGLLCLLTDHIDEELVASGPDLKVISQCAVGYDNIELDAATRRKIPVGNTPGVLTDATADFAFTLLMSAARRIVEAQDYVRAGRWTTWGLTLLLGQDVQGTTLGLVGFGRIGQAVARRARGFGMRILYHDLARRTEAEKELGAEFVGLEELLRQSDYVSLHVNLTAETKGLIDSVALALMKPTAILINTSRGPVVDTDALLTALQDKQIAYAALDVTDPEPLPAEHPLLSLSNLILAPHIASATISSRNLMALRAVENLVAGLRDEPLPYCVNPEVYD